MYQDLRNINMKEYCRHKVKMGTYRQIAIKLKEKNHQNWNSTKILFLSGLHVYVSLIKMGTFICAHAWICFKLCILLTHYIRTMKMYLSN